MKIAIISGHWQGGGAESVARGLFEYLNKFEINCYYLYMCGKKIDKNKVIKCGYEWEHYLHAANARLFDCDGYFSTLSTLKLINTLKSIGPDVVNIHNIVCYSINYELLFSYLKRSNTKVVWTLHDCWSFTGHCIAIDEYRCQKWKTHCQKCPAKNSYPQSILLDNSYHNYEMKKKCFQNISNMLLITPSEWMKSCVKQSFLHDYQVHVVHNGLNLEIFKPVESNIIENNGLDPQKKTLLSVASRWTKFKGLKYFTDLANEMKTDDYNFVVIGNITQDKNEQSNNIKYINRTNNIEELVQWYSAADVLVNPTLADNFPTVNLEALACGTPVVTFNTGGSWESVGAGCGALANQYSVNSLKDAVLEILKRKVSVLECRTRAMQFSADKRYNEYLKIFKSCSE